MKPKVFIGSSREGVKIADAIHYNLTYDAECTVWKDGVFQLSSNTLAELIRVLRDSDFGIFVFSPDDLTIMRNAASSTVRDNVLFELGLFIGRLGQERCFFLVPDGATDLRLPSDLAGITPGRYESGRSDDNWMAALNPACMQMKMQMARLKPFQDVPIPALLPNTGEAPEGPVEKKQIRAASASKITAQYYKRSILVKGVAPKQKDELKAFASWNGTLSGWIVPKSKEAALRQWFPDVVIEPADEV